jgi:MoaA/NifB/PqqE/SkfB family radical SAM enzyme
MKFYDKITNLDIENSSICNANCPQCTRELYGNDHSWFLETYLNTDFFDRIPDDVYNGLHKILFSGSMGDPCAAPNFIDVIKKIRSKTNALIKISTNGGMKSTVFWNQLAEALGDKSEVIFAIDGLEDTNHIYRVNVNFNKVIENACAFINSGGNATWKFIAFKHNQHQIDLARKKSVEFGFKKFETIRSHRFATDAILGRQFFGSDGTLIEPPSDETFKHEVVFQPLIRVDEWLKKSEDTQIDCFAKFNKSLYIDSSGNLVPCCFLGSYSYAKKPLNIQDGWDKLWEEYKHFLNLYNNNWYDILDNEFFSKVEQSWDGRKYSEGRIATCAANCGNFDNRLNNPKLSV